MTGWVDAPDERKAHQGAVPSTGGVTVLLVALSTSVFVGNFFGGAAMPTLSSSAASGLPLGLAVCFVTGFWDDRFPLRARYRLVAQLLACTYAAASGNLLQDLGMTFSPTPLGLSILAIPLTVTAMTGLVNAYNMSDGLDGLCGSYAFVALTAFGVCAAYVDKNLSSPAAFGELAPVVLPFLGGIAGFLVYNFRHPWRSHASSFLGDAGSMALGFLLGWMASGSQPVMAQRRFHLSLASGSSLFPSSTCSPV